MISTESLQLRILDVLIFLFYFTITVMRTALTWNWNQQQVLKNMYFIWQCGLVWLCLQLTTHQKGKSIRNFRARKEWLESISWIQQPDGKPSGSLVKGLPSTTLKFSLHNCLWAVMNITDMTKSSAHTLARWKINISDHMTTLHFFSTLGTKGIFKKLNLD